MKTLTIVGLTLMTLCVLSCGKKARTQKLDGELMHTVLFWLAEDANELAFIDGTNQFLKSIKEVKTFYVGIPAMTPRDVVDNTYSVYITMTFEKKEDLKTYLDHPLHLAYVEANKEKWDKVLIYDEVGD
jgi:hypothetical protein